VKAWLTPRRADALLAAAVAALSLLEVVLVEAITPKPGALACELAAAIALAWRRRAPLATACVVGAAMALETVVGVPIQEPAMPLFAYIVATYSVAAHCALPRALAGLAVIVAATGAAVGGAGEDVDNVIFGLVWAALCWTAGRVVRGRTDTARSLADRAARLEAERAEQVERAAAAERGRIARELHDVISHSVSVMVVQAGAAEEILRRDPERAVAPLRAVQDTGREALAELGRLLGVLRGDAAELGLAPQPGIGDLGDLVAQSERAGVPVELRVEGPERPLPRGVELSLYRIVQEALTNTRKHAGPARAAIVLRYDDAAVVAEISDDGHRNGNGNGNGGGHGLVGMRERVAVYGGTLDAGPGPHGGYAVRARIPLAPR